MDKEKDQIIKPDTARPDANIEKEKAEIFKFSEEVRDEYIGRSKGTKKEADKLGRLEKYERIINEKKAKTEEAGKPVDMKKIIADSLRGVPRLMRAMESNWQQDEKKEAKQVEETVITEKEEVGQKKAEAAETKEDDITSKVNNLIENIKIKLGAAQVSGLISGEKLEKFKKIFDNKLDGLNGILKGTGASDSEMKLNEFYKDLLKLKDTFFDVKEKPPRKRGKKNIKKLEIESETEEVDEAEKEFIRKAAEITLKKIEKYEELNADTEKEGDEKFKKKSRELWKNFVVHGRVRFDEKIQEPVVEGPTDLDGKASIKLLNMAGFNVDEKNVEYVAPGGRSKEPGKFHLDTGNKDGIVILEDGTVFIDHHGPGSDSSVSTTKFVYRALTGLGLLEKEKYLDNMVEFVNQVDNFKYPNEKEYFENYFKNSWKTLLGLYRMVSMDNLLKFFQHKKHDTGESLSPAEPLTPGLLKKFKFIYTKGKKEFNKSESHKKRVKKSLEELQKMEKEGFIIDSEAYGKIAINIGGRIPTGIDGAKAFGCDTYISWNSDKNSFFISSLRGEALRDEFKQGLNVRKTMWIRPVNGEGALTTKLGEILEKMTDGKLKLKGELKKYLEEEKSEKPEKEFTAEEEKILDVFVKYAKKFQQKMEAEADWAEYSDEQKNDTIKIQTADTIKLKMDEKKLFAGKADKVSEIILSKA